MNILSRGVKSIKGYKIKSIILLMLVILLGTVMISTLLMTNGIVSTTMHIRRNLPTIVMLTDDDEALEQAGYTIQQRSQGYVTHYFEWLTRDMAYEIAALPYVRDFDYTYVSIPIELYSFDLKQYIPENIDGDWDDLNAGIDHIFLSLNAVSRPNFIQIEENIWELVAGRSFTEEEMQANSNSSEHISILISESFAQVNTLSVGSIINFYTDMFAPPEDAQIPEGGLTGFYIDNIESIWSHEYFVFEDFPFTFEVIGILSIPYTPTNDWDTFVIQLDQQNRIFTPSSRVPELSYFNIKNQLEWMTAFGVPPTEDEIAQWERRLNLIQPTWLLYDMADFDAFAEQANEILPEFSIVEDMSFVHQSVLTSMENMNLLMNQALIFTIAATLIVLTLIILLYLRDRKHEIGVYLALGEKKGRIVLQILFEVLSVTVVGIVFAFLLGGIVSSQISNFLLQEAFINYQQEVCDPMIFICWNPISHLEWYGFGNRQMGMGIDELIEIFDLSFTAQLVTLFFGVTLTTAILSTIVPIAYVLEMKPKEILLRGNVG